MSAYDVAKGYSTVREFYLEELERDMRVRQLRQQGYAPLPYTALYPGDNSPAVQSAKRNIFALYWVEKRAGER